MSTDKSINYALEMVIDKVTNMSDLELSAILSQEKYGPVDYAVEGIKCFFNETTSTIYENDGPRWWLGEGFGF